MNAPSRSRRSVGQVLAALLLVLAPGRSLAETDIQAEAELKQQQFRREQEHQQWQQFSDGVAQNIRNGNASPDAKRAFDSAGYDIGVAWPFLNEPGWSSKLGFSLGMGARGSQFRCDLMWLRWDRQDSTGSLGKSRIPIFMGWRGWLAPDLLWYQAGGELGYESEDLVHPTLNLRGDVASLFYGVAAGAGLTFGDELYFSLAALFHYDRRFWASTDVGSDEQEIAFGGGTPFYLSVGLSIGYQSR